MSIVTIFLILLVLVFATVAYLTEPSEDDKRIRERLGGLERHLSDEEREGGIEKQVTFSRIIAVDRFLRNNSIALKLQLVLDQSKVPWTVGRFFSFSALLMVAGATLGNWRIPVGFTGW